MPPEDDEPAPRGFPRARRPAPVSTAAGRVAVNSHAASNSRPRTSPPAPLFSFSRRTAARTRLPAEPTSLPNVSTSVSTDALTRSVSLGATGRPVGQEAESETCCSTTRSTSHLCRSAVRHCLAMTTRVRAHLRNGRPVRAHTRRSRGSSSFQSLVVLAGGGLFALAAAFLAGGQDSEKPGYRPSTPAVVAPAADRSGQLGVTPSTVDESHPCYPFVAAC